MKKKNVPGARDASASRALFLLMMVWCWWVAIVVVVFVHRDVV
jgi:hypothetical protein